jgi:uroporphyrinogen-III synthase
LSSDPDRWRARPLAGVRVVVTRAERQAAGLAGAFAAAGAEVELLPLLEVAPPADPAPVARAAAELRLYDWVVFTSANAVHALLGAMADGAGGADRAVGAATVRGAVGAAGAGGAAPEGGISPRFAETLVASAVLPPRLRVAAIGAATAAALRGAGVEPAVVAAAGEQSAAGLLAILLRHLDCGQRVLLPQAADALPTLRDGLLAAGIAAVAVVAYDKRLPPASPGRAAELFGGGRLLGWVTFTSPSVVRHFAGVFGEEWQHRRGELRAASIGPVTTAELRRQGVEPAAEAASPGDDGLVAAVAAVATAEGTGLPDPEG